MIDITRKAVEETAATVLQSYRERFEPQENGTATLPLPPGVSMVRARAEPALPPTPPVPPTPPAPARPASSRPAAGKARPKKGS